MRAVLLTPGREGHFKDDKDADQKGSDRQA